MVLDQLLWVVVEVLGFVVVEVMGVGSNEHFAVLQALGLSPLVKDEKIPVPKHKCFFGQLRELGLIDDQGCASKPLEMEVKAKTVLNLIAKEAECRTCAKNGNPRSVGSMMTKCPQCHQYFG